MQLPGTFILDSNEINSKSNGGYYNIYNRGLISIFKYIDDKKIRLKILRKLLIKGRLRYAQI